MSYDPGKDGWFGAGWASFKTGHIPKGFVPPPGNDEALKEWLAGVKSAFADYPDEEAMKGILDGDPMRGEAFEDALLRIAPEVYVVLAERGEV